MCFNQLYHIYLCSKLNHWTEFVTPDLIETDTFLFIQTKPSELTGNSVGLIQWKKEKGNYVYEKVRDLIWEFTKNKKRLS